ncbi:hypothetical protein BDV25DRAFT_109073 [Aspergillus avenaceus]|uniref:Enoyl reductase (ER) domain-containing protein n=1 Tax=Aspergillus avenaceus TaxID=36643 RepID=A0A5N6U6W6_ASPAV|nr:hypothetical protein BDV25DRAFT_109073 [Aspergillus avenaceus]
MQAIRLHPSANTTSYSPENPAPSSALHLDHDIPIPKPSQPGDILIRIKATTVVRDMLTWPETYHHEYMIPGHDFAGTVVEVFPGETQFKPGDEVFGMAHADRGSMWAEYGLVKDCEVALKPENLSWEQAAALPLSALTAYEALVEKAGVLINRVAGKAPSESKAKTILITGAAGGVGIYIVQLAAIAGLYTVASSSSNLRNRDLLLELGADETVEYGELMSQNRTWDIVIDTVGGNVLADCWSYVKDDGSLVSVDSASFDFVKKHEEKGIRKKNVNALFFIVEPNAKALNDLAHYARLGLLRPFVLDTHPLARASEAYESAGRRVVGRGKLVLRV